MGWPSLVEERKGTQGRGWTEANRDGTAGKESFLCSADEITPDSSEILNTNIWILY